MDPLLDALNQTLPKNICPPDAIAGIMREWKGMGENVLKSLVDYVSDIESREQKLGEVRDSLERRLVDMEVRERDFELFREREKRKLEEEMELREEKLDEQLKLVHEHIESLEAAQAEVHGLRAMEREKLKEIEKREMEFNLFRDEKLREIALKEEILSRKRVEFAEDVRLENKKLSERAELGHGVIEKLGSGISMLEGMKVRLDEKFSEIKSWEAVAHKSLIAILNEADSIRESMEKQLTERDEMEQEFNMLLEDKLQKSEARERELCIMRKKFLMEIKSREEKLTERCKEIESREVNALKSLNESLNEASLLGEAMEKRFNEFEEMKKGFNSIQEDKMQELEAKERQLIGLKTQLLKVVKWKDGKSTEVQNTGHRNLVSLEDVLCKKLKQIECLEVSLNAGNVRLQEIENREREFQLYEQGKMRELALAEEKLRLVGKEFIREVMLSEQKFDIQDKMVHGLLQRLELAQNHVKELNKLVAKRFKEIGFKETELNYTKDWVEKKLAELEVIAKGMKEHVMRIELCEMSEEKGLQGKKKEAELKKTSLEPEFCPRGIKLKVGENGLLNEREVNHPQSSDDTNIIGPCSRSLPDHSKLDVQMDEKTLDMLLNNSEKDLELVGAEIFKVLFLSSDPAKLVLDAVERFYVPCLGKRDFKPHMRRKCILLLDQLTKMSPSIHHSIREAAIKLASQWKSQMIVAENSLEVLGFLQFVAAYNLSSCFQKNELLSLLGKVALHKQTPELFRILGLSGSISGFIKNLIKRKRHLLASTYIHECGLEKTFTQAVVLNGYVQHVKVKHQTEDTSPNAQEKAISGEIADLQVAIEHIIKHGLESEYSPAFLTTRIKQLEGNLSSMRSRLLLSTDAQKQERSKRFGQSQTPHVFNERNAHEEHNVARNPSCHAENGPLHLKRHINDVPKFNSHGASKRRKLNRGFGSESGSHLSHLPENHRWRRCLTTRQEI
ncbi:protein FRIGIDA [Striga asiatica]|uniref:FRIGIDA-like protein n=1 Tax=Striga asiatica TaxID=4170 RepID=A0A5A7PAP5_STRAF|nr:protein FRIGIDA [Striga asiatica]